MRECSLPLRTLSTFTSHLFPQIPDLSFLFQKYDVAFLSLFVYEIIFFSSKLLQKFFLTLVLDVREFL